MAANTADFLGEGTFQAPQKTPAQLQIEEDDRRAALRRASRNLATANQPYAAERGIDQSETQQTSNAAAQYQLDHPEEYGRGDDIYALAMGGTIAAGIGGAALAGAAPLSGSALGAAPAIAGPTAGGVIAAPAGATAMNTIPAGAAAFGAAPAAGAASSWLTPSNIIGGIGLAGTLGLGIYDQMDSDAEKQLLAKQEQMANEAKERQRIQRGQDMDALGQRMLAFNPQNQLMAEMFGPGAAFTPEQFAGMVADPGGRPQGRPETINYQGGDPAMLAEVDTLMKQRQEWEAAEERRRQAMLGGIQQPGPGPAPLARPITPQAARRF
jgi:hypothetical protein